MNTNSKSIIDGIFESQPTLEQMAEKASFSRAVPATYPGGVFDRPMGRSVRIYTPEIKGSVWGQPEGLTLSLLKTDVYDRRYFRRKPVTLEEVMKGAFSDANKDFDDMSLVGLTRPKYGTLLETGGRFDAQAWSENYPFPCQKAVGQAIVLADDLKGACQPCAQQSMRDGTARISVEADGSSMDLEYLCGMKRNVAAVQVDYRNLKTPLRFRLYRHQDQGHRRYMDENGNYIPKEERGIVYTPVDRSEPVGYYDYEADADFNYPFDPPSCGQDGRFFWVEQVFPKDRAFPEGFRYVYMGMVSDPGAQVSCQQLQKGLGTPQRMPRDPQGKLILPSITVGHDGELERLERDFSYVRSAPGVAATAALPQAGSGSAVLYTVAVTCNEAENYIEEAKRQLLEAERLGMAGLREENRSWYTDLYRRRENGRIVVGNTRGRKEAADAVFLNDAYLSWSYSHGGFCAPDPSKLQGSAGYAAFDVDTQSWHSLPCYNELFTEGKWFVRNQYEIMTMWPKLITFWRDALKQKARDIYDLPGMIWGHGYLPPVTPDPWYIENQTLDFCMEVPGQVMKVIWNLWDYTGDEAYLRETAYPLLRELAIFYEAFARRGWDGSYYHLLPTVETESYGIAYQLKYSRDTTGAIAMFRAVLNLACQAAGLLEVDGDLIPGWKEVADNLPPYPTFNVGCGKILAGNPGAMPRWQAGDHEINSALYPATLADEINLDSPQELKDLIIRTADTVRTKWNDDAYIAMGCFPEEIPCSYNTPAVPITDEEALSRQLVATPERMLNSRSGRIHLFPAVPGWSVITFRNLLARGGFAVSAAKDETGVTAVVISSARTLPCRLMDPWDTWELSITDLTTGQETPWEPENDNGRCILFCAEAGHSYSIDRL